MVGKAIKAISALPGECALSLLSSNCQDICLLRLRVATCQSPPPHHIPFKQSFSVRFLTLMKIFNWNPPPTPILKDPLSFE